MRFTHPLVMAFNVFVLLAAHVGSALAGVPSQLSAQGVLRDAAGDVIDTSEATIVFRLYDAASAGTLLWSEAQDLPVVMGAFDTLLPQSPLSELPAAVQVKIATGAPLWLSLQLEGQPELPRVAIVSVPYAFTANRALVASALDCSGCIDVSAIDTTTFTAQHLGYAPGDNDLVTATTVAGAIGQLDALLAALDAQVEGIAATHTLELAEVQTTIASLQQATADLEAAVTALSASGGVVVYKDDGTTPLGKWLAFGASGNPSHPCDWRYLLPNGTQAVLAPRDCAAYQPAGKILYSNGSCTSPLGVRWTSPQTYIRDTAQPTPQYYIVESQPTFGDGPCPVGPANQDCPAGVCNCFAWSWQDGVCTFDPIRNDGSAGYNRVTSLPTPACGGGGSCVLR